MKTRFFVRCVANGSVIGSMAMDETTGATLNRRDANRIAREENAQELRRKPTGARFEYIVAEVQS